MENFSVSKRFKMMHDEFKCSEDNLIFYNLNAKFAICLRDKNYNYIAKSSKFYKSFFNYINIVP